MKNLSTQIATTREQSERLLSMGVKPETADMQHYQNAQSKWMLYANHGEDDSIGWTQYRTPAWSLSRLISIMPKCIVCENKEYGFALYSCHDDKTFSMQYVRDNGHEGTDVAVFKDSESLFECCVSMIDWLIKNNHFCEEYLKGGKP